MQREFPAPLSCVKTNCSGASTATAISCCAAASAPDVTSSPAALLHLQHCSDNSATFEGAVGQGSQPGLPPLHGLGLSILPLGKCLET